ncbi:MAG: hypothetical protein ACYTEL_18860 [Planctomycetota bacterium]|jgi:hypothetical protein
MARDYRKRSTVVVLEQRLLKSKAYRSLRTPTAYFVFGIFMTKRKLAKGGRKGKEQWEITNNGEIEFTYDEAEEKYGICPSTFRNAIDELRDKGFLDIAATGMGVHKVTTHYSISERWKLYGTREYEPPKPRPRKPVNRGFQEGNRYGRNCRTKGILTVVAQHSSTVTRQHSGAEMGNSRADALT